MPSNYRLKNLNSKRKKSSRKTSTWRSSLIALSLAGAISMPAFAQSNGDTFVHLFEWDWDDIGRECTDFLGPKGYKAVQVPPPQEHRSKDFGADDEDAWWLRYQPMSYSIGNSRSGTEAQFQQMVTDCNNAGVDIYVDAVINHLAADGGQGTPSTEGRTAQDKFYPYIPYDNNNFNNCGKPEIEGGDYNNNAFNVRYCDLVKLDDLKTGSEKVRSNIVGFMNGLIDMGVKGFRIDAAKHMPPADIQNIISRLKPITGTNTPVYIFQEVIDKVPGSEAIRATEYSGFSDVTEFQWAENIGRKFQNLFEPQFGANGKLADLETIGSPAWGMLPSDKAVIFVSNHDDQRGDGRFAVVDFNDEQGLNFIAEAYQMAQAYGYPKVMSSYYFNANEPRAVSRPAIEGPDSPIGGCEAPYGPNRGGSEGWVCEHRWEGLANMVAFRKAAENQPQTNWWDNNSNQIAFGRNGKGFIAINADDFAMQQQLTTGMADGDYCNILEGSFVGNQCTGQVISVSGGKINVDLPNKNTALAIHVNAKLGGIVVGGDRDVSFTCNNGNTSFGTSVYVVGNSPELGNWSPANAVKLDPTSYPTWTGTITLPENQAAEWKCIKRLESGGGTQWQGGSNNQLGAQATSTQGSF